MGVSDGAPYTASVISTSTTPLRGEQGLIWRPWSSICPGGSAVVGFEGAHGSFMDSLVVYCAPVVASSSFGTIALSLGSASALPVVGGPGGDPFPRVDCPAGEVARGVNLRTGFYVDLIQLVCGAPTAP